MEIRGLGLGLAFLLLAGNMWRDRGIRPTECPLRVTFANGCTVGILSYIQLNADNLKTQEKTNRLTSSARVIKLVEVRHPAVVKYQHFAV